MAPSLLVEQADADLLDPSIPQVGGAGDPSPIERVAAGYRLNVGEDRLDLSEFGDSARRAQAAREDGRWDEALAARDGAAMRAVLLEHLVHKRDVVVEQLRNAATQRAKA